MGDNRFFHTPKPVSLSRLVELTGAVLHAGASANAQADRMFRDVAPLDRAGENEVSFLDNVKYVEAFKASKAGACFVRPKFVAAAPAHMALLVTEDPYSAYASTAQLFYPPAPIEPFLSPQAAIAASASIGKSSRVEAGAFIGERVIIGERCWIGPGAVIDAGVTMGDDCRIGANSTVSHTVMGNRVILLRGAHVGQDGFGYAPGPKGIIKVPQLGRVVIADDVEIGSGTCIDRGAGPDTVIGYGCKIDNLVQIGHNVQLGKFVVIAAQCGISGSTQIGDGAMLGGQAGLAGHLRIGAGAKIAAQAGVMHDVPPGATFGGFPAVPIREWHRQTAALGKIIKKSSNESE